MEYLCLECGYKWDTLATGYRRCPKCLSYDTAPATFWLMVETGRKLGISPHTPLLDVINAFQSVWGHESLLNLGIQEFWRVMRRVIKEIENPRYAKRGEL